MRAPSRLLRILGWSAIAALGAVAIATLAWSRGEHVSALWMVVAALWVFAGVGQWRRQGLCQHEQMGPFRAPFCGDRGARPARRAGLGRAVWLPSGTAVDAGRGHAGRRRARQH